jgi:AraC-like DNA-binding protein
MTLARLPFNMLDGLQKAGINLDEVAALAGLEPDDLRKPLTSEQADRVFVVMYEKAGNPAAGLAVGLQPMRSELFGVVGFAGMLSSDFGAALARIARYNALVSACQIDLHAGADECEARIRYDGPLRPYSRSRLDIQMGTLLMFGRTFTERKILPVRVTLKERPSYHALYADAFCCAALFDQPHDAIVFRRADLDLPLVSANQRVAAMFEDAAERDLQTYEACEVSGNGTAAAVREILERQLHGDVPDIESVSRVLFLSARTLQRRLAEEGVRFSTLLDEVRLEMAQRYLSAGRATLTEIAYLLGFSEPNSFFRSFKRWTGKTPADFRQTH